MRKTAPVPASQRTRSLSAVHALKTQAGMSDDEYRDMLASLTGKRSAADLDAGELRRVFDHFTRLGIKSHARTKLDRVGCPRRKYLSKIDAQLAVANRDRVYLQRMVKRICKVDALEFCDEAALTKLIAALALDAKRHGRDYP